MQGELHNPSDFQYFQIRPRNKLKKMPSPPPNLYIERKKHRHRPSCMQRPPLPAPSLPTTQRRHRPPDTSKAPSTTVPMNGPKQQAMPRQTHQSSHNSPTATQEEQCTKPQAVCQDNENGGLQRRNVLWQLVLYYERLTTYPSRLSK